MGRPVLHPTDFSKASNAAFARSIVEARQTKSELVILHVLAPIVPLAGATEGYLSPQLYEEMSTSARAAADKQLARLLARARTAPVKARSLLAEGVAHEEIVRVAKRLRAGVIVVGTHGRTGVVQLVLGSVAARVAATAPCPVLTVRGRG
ncbi:MAG TPA: universal stress protein [Methylomirabilota bacterium]|jgi:nucleotide-binding universal stress UspA family protein|nr:universal stress protein [Methylomirabilota bacterium]